MWKLYENILPAGLDSEYYQIHSSTRVLYAAVQRCGMSLEMLNLCCRIAKIFLMRRSTWRAMDKSVRMYYYSLNI